MILPRALLVLVLAGCSAAPQGAGSARADQAAALRNCATVTERCRGVAALAPSMPQHCQAAACLLTTSAAGRRETLGAMDMPNGRVCGYRRMEAGGGTSAILGLIARSADGTVQYASASFPRSGAGLPSISSVAGLKAACASLN